MYILLSLLPFKVPNDTCHRLWPCSFWMGFYCGDFLFADFFLLQFLVWYTYFIPDVSVCLLHQSSIWVFLKCLHYVLVTFEGATTV